MSDAYRYRVSFLTSVSTMVKWLSVEINSNSPNFGEIDAILAAIRFLSHLGVDPKSLSDPKVERIQ